MTISISKGYDPASQVSGKTLPIAGFVYASQFRCKSTTPQEAVLANITSPLDRQERIRLAYKEVSDVYSNTGINPAYFPPSKQGVQLLAQVNDIWRLVDSEDASWRQDLPLSAHLVVKVPACENISQADILELLGRLVGALYDATTGTDAWRITELLRGVLVPKGL